MENRNKGGNLYNKYETNNPIVILFMNKFFKDLNFFLDSVNINTVLDVGCGEGYVTNHIRQYKNDINIEGIEYYNDVIQKAKSLHPFIKVSQGSIYNLPFDDKTFDLIVLSEVLEHLEQPEKAIEEIIRVSNKYCIITVPNEPFFRIANLIRFKYLSAFGNTPGHIQNWTNKDFEKLLNKYFCKVTVKKSTLWQIALCEINIYH
jgi:ubiquinone/menaquinone biosynthesis C-methylase UbiE